MLHWCTDLHIFAPSVPPLPLNFNPYYGSENEGNGKGKGKGKESVTMSLPLGSYSATSFSPIFTYKSIPIS